MPVIRPGTSPVTVPSTTTPALTPTPVATPATPTVAPVPTTSAATAAALANPATTRNTVTTAGGGNDIVGADGTLLPGLTGENLRAELIELATPADPGTTKPGPFATVTKPELLVKVASAIEKEFKAVAGQPPDEVTGLAWRTVRASCLYLLQEAALAAKALNGDVQAVLKKTVDVIKQEPLRALRDFAFEALVAHAEAKTLPEVKEARELLYPSAPPYEKWPRTIKVVRYCDDDGSKIDDQIWFFKEMMGAKHTKNADGSHTLIVKRPGLKHDLEVTIPPKDKGLNIMEPVGDGQTHVIEYCGHAGHGNFFEAQLANGARGTGEGQVMAAYQCWGEGNTETLERQCPDMQYLSTTEMTSDSYDFVMQKRFFEGLMQEQSWEQIMKGAVADLKRQFKDDIKKGELHEDVHYLPPNNRNGLIKHYDRDADGVRDGEDHIFNVIYPRRVDTSGGYDPVVQAVPRFALDGSELSKSVNALSLIFRYDHLLAPADEAKLVWDPTKWQPGGFFEPQQGDLSAFRFTKTANGEVRVALSTLFAHTSREDLQRMLAIETGLWLGKEAGLSADKQGAMAVTMLQRMIDGQGEWFSKEDGLLDEFWAEEQMLFSRYGIKGFSIADVTQAIGMSEHDDFKPQHFEKAAKFLKGASLDKLASTPPQRVGTAITVPAGGISLMNGTEPDVSLVANALKTLGVNGTLEQTAPSWLSSPLAATNMIVTVDDNGKKVVYGLGIDTGGTILAAARLELDLSKKIGGSVNAALARIATSGGLTVSDAQQAFATAAKTNADPLDAFAAAAKLLRASAGVSATFDSSALYDLQSQGLVDAQKLQTATQLVTQLFPSEYQITAEAALFKALSTSKELDKKMGPVVQRFNQAVLATNGDEAAWKAAAEVLRDAIPQTLSLAPDQKASDLLVSLDQSAVLAAARPKLAAALGLTPIDIGKLALQTAVASYGAAVDTTAAVKLFEQRARGGDVVGGLLAALDSLVDANGWDPYVFQEALSLDRLGLFAPTDPALDKAREAITKHRVARQIEQGVGGLVTASDDKADVKAAKLRFRAAMDAGDSLADALKKAIGKLDKTKLDGVIGAFVSLSYSFDGKTARVPLMDVVSQAMGMTRSEVVLQERLNAFSQSQQQGGAAVMRAYRTAYLAAQQRGGAIADSLAAGTKAIFPLLFGNDAYFFTSASTGSFAVAEETEAAGKQLATERAMLSLRECLQWALQSFAEPEQKRALAEVDKAFVAALADPAPFAKAMQAVKALRRPANAAAGSVAFYGLEALSDPKLKAEMAGEIMRLNGVTPEAHVKQQILLSLDYAIASVPAGTTIDRQALSTTIDGFFARGDVFKAAIDSLTTIVGATKQAVYSDLATFFQTGVVAVPPDFEAQIAKAVAV